jgi:hypothetical protein
MHFAFAQQERFLDLGTWGRHACQIRRQTGTLAAAQRSELFSDVVLQRKMIELFGESDYWTNAAVNGLINLFSYSERFAFDVAAKKLLHQANLPKCLAQFVSWGGENEG